MPKKRANGEGSLRKRKDGRWEGRYTAGCDPATGKPIHKSVLAKTQSEAKEKLKQAIAEAEKLDMSRAKSYTLGAWIKLWYEVYAEPRLREKTKDYYLNYIDNHTAYYWYFQWCWFGWCYDYDFISYSGIPDYTGCIYWCDACGCLYLYFGLEKWYQACTDYFSWCCRICVFKRWYFWIDDFL